MRRLLARAWRFDRSSCPCLDLQLVDAGEDPWEGNEFPAAPFPFSAPSTTVEAGKGSELKEWEEESEAVCGSALTKFNVWLGGMLKELSNWGKGVEELAEEVEYNVEPVVGLALPVLDDAFEDGIGKIGFPIAGGVSSVYA